MFDDFNEALENIQSNVEEVLETTLRDDFGIEPYVEGTKLLSDELKEFMETHKVIPQYDYRKVSENDKYVEYEMHTTFRIVEYTTDYFVRIGNSFFLNFDDNVAIVLPTAILGWEEDPRLTGMSLDDAKWVAKEIGGEIVRKDSEGNFLPYYMVD